MRQLLRHDLRRPDGRRVRVYGDVPPEPAAFADELVAGAAAAIHKRLDVFTSAWIAISPARNQRPLDRAEADDCPFCPGGFELPFAYDAAVLDNRFPSFQPEPPAAPQLDGRVSTARGRCEVVLYTHRHDAEFGALSAVEIGRVLAIWRDRTRELWDDPAHEYVFVFENRGAEAGATIAHPHGQIYALDHVPPLTAAKDGAHRNHRRVHDSCLSCSATAADDRSARVVAANDSFAIAVPFAPRWPFEVSIRARRHDLRRLADLTPPEQRDLASALRDTARRYDALMGFEVPYMMVAQEAPRGQTDWHLAFEFYPLHRGAEKTKIRASVETALGLFLNDVLPEDAARLLRAIDLSAETITEDALAQVVPARQVEPAGRP
jgi:UDPglucose--hexose-1-phosphate uridylyltransferase